MRPHGNAAELERRRIRAVELVQQGESRTVVARILGGLGAGGCAGMRRAFEIIRAEFERSMRLVGVRSVEEIRADGSAIRRRNLLIGNSWLPDFVF